MPAGPLQTPIYRPAFRLRRARRDEHFADKNGRLLAQNEEGRVPYRLLCCLVFQAIALFPLSAVAHAQKSQGASEAIQEAETEILIKFGGFDRSYILYVPNTAPASAAGSPLVIALHGGGGKAASTFKGYKWREAADKYGFVIASPQALAENGSAWVDLSGRATVNADDVAFISAVIDDVSRRVKLDPQRLYATGFSSGASMTQMLGLRLSDRLAAIAPVTGHLWKEETPEQPLPVLMIFGDSDLRNPPEGGPIPGVSAVKPSQAANADIWVRQMKCDPEPRIDHPVAAVTRKVWDACAGRGRVEFWLVAGLGHQWAGGTPSKQNVAILGPYSDAIDDTETISAFFLAHPRPAPP